MKICELRKCTFLFYKSRCCTQRLYKTLKQFLLLYSRKILRLKYKQTSQNIARNVSTDFYSLNS